VNKVLVVFRRELRSYFATPLAYVFIVIFLVLAASSNAARPTCSLSFAGIPGCIWC
jgi:ABC-type transport system involved in multi-copper enzyme maturation permease subunit